MGDQLAKGWADDKAQPAKPSTHQQYENAMTQYFAWQKARYRLADEAELQAEEDMLP